MVRAKVTKISHSDMGDNHIDTVISPIISPYPISISRMTISIWLITISIYRIPDRNTILNIDNPIDISLMSDLLHGSPISICHTDIGSYLVTRARDQRHTPHCRATGPLRRFISCLLMCSFHCLLMCSFHCLLILSAMGHLGDSCGWGSGRPRRAPAAARRGRRTCSASRAPR